MRRKTHLTWLIFSGLLLLGGFAAAQGVPQENQSQFARRFQNGSQFFNLQRWNEATIEFRRAQESATTNNDRSAALYWVILSQLAHTDYGSALRDMDELQRTAPTSVYARDMAYHRARVYFNQGYFEDALFFFNRYINTTEDIDRESADRRAAAYFWMGESLYTMGQLDEAEKFYAWVIGRYPESPKMEAASYRIDLIKQKKIEAELLALLQWSHEESLRTSENFQRTIRTYEHTLNAYQRRIAELTSAGNMFNQYDLLDSTYDIPPNMPQNQNDFLLEKARELGDDVENILREQEPHNPSGGQ